MKLIHDLIIRRLDVSKDLDLNKDYFKSIWHFYQVYFICLNVLGFTDNELIKKKRLLRELILNPDSLELLNKLKEYISIDSKVVEITLNSLVEKEEELDIIEDFYPDSIFGVNLDDRGN